MLSRQIAFRNDKYRKHFIYWHLNETSNSLHFVNTLWSILNLNIFSSSVGVVSFKLNVFVFHDFH